MATKNPYNDPYGDGRNIFNEWGYDYARTNRTRLEEEEEEKERKRLEEEVEKARQEAEKQSKDNSFGGKASRFFKGAGNFAKSVAEETSQKYEQLSGGLAETLADITGESEDIATSYQVQQENASEGLRMAQERLLDPNLSPEERKRWEKVRALNEEQAREATQGFTERQNEVYERTDPGKGGAATIGIGVDILAGSGLGRGLRTGRLAKHADEGISASRKIAEGAGFGAGVELVGSPARQFMEDEEITLEDTLKDLAFGGAIGGAAGGLDAAISSRARNALKRKEQGEADFQRSQTEWTDPETGEVLEIAPVSRQLGDGVQGMNDRLREIDEILDDVRGGNAVSEFEEVAPENMAQIGTQNFPIESPDARLRYEQHLKDVEPLDQEISMLRDQMEDILTPQKYAEAAKNMDIQYENEIKEIMNLPEPRRSMLAQSINSNFEQRRAALDDAYVNRQSDKGELQNKLIDAQEKRRDMEAQAEEDLTKIGEKDAEFKSSRQAQNMARTPDELRSLMRERQEIQDRLDDHSLAQAAEAPLPVSDIGEVNPAVRASINRDAVQTEKSLLASAKKDYNPGIVAPVSTPERVFQSAGLGDLFSVVREGYDEFHRGMNRVHREMDTFAETIGRNKKSNEKIARWLDGDKVPLTPEEQTVANAMKKQFATWADEMEIPQEERIRDYLPHLFNSDKADLDPEFQRLMKKNSSSKIKAFFDEKRRGAEDYNFDALTAYEVYAKKALQKQHLTEGLELMDSAKKRVSNSMAKYINDQMNLNKGIPDDQNQIIRLVDNSLGKLTMGQWKEGDFARRSGQARGIVYMGTLGGNVGSAMRNLSQTVNTFGMLGSKWTGYGSGQAVKAMSNRRNGGLDELYDMGVLDDTLRQSLDSEFNPMLNKAAGAGKELLWWQFQRAEEFNRATAYYGAKSRALAKGASEAEAKKAGATMARKTQFKFSPMDTPHALNGAITKNFTQFMSFNIKQMEFLKDRIVGDVDSLFVKKGDHYVPTVQGARNIARLALGSAAFATTFGAMLGMEAEDFVPFYQDISGGALPMSPLTSLVLGNEKTTGLGNILSGKDRFGGDASRTEIAGDFAKELPGLLIPGGTQAKKTIEGIDAFNKGYSETDAGRVRFPIEQSDFNAFKSSVFGQYNTNEGQDYYKSGFFGAGAHEGESMSEAESEMFKNASPAKRQMYYQFFDAANQLPSRDSASREITSLAREGQINKGQRKAAEYNAEIDSIFESLFREYGGMIPEDLLEYIEKKKIDPARKAIERRDRDD